jgi:excisionase family DNA binding protein
LHEYRHAFRRYPVRRRAMSPTHTHIKGGIMSQPVMLTIHELCARYSLRPWTVRQYCSQRRIPHVKVGRKVLFNVEEIEQWLKAQAVTPRMPRATIEM